MAWNEWATRRAAPWALAGALVLALAGGGPARAAGESETAAARDEGERVKLGEVVVREETKFTAIEATSATVLDNAAVVDRIYVTPLDMIKLSPGVTISQYHQGGTPAAMQMRGFESVGHGRDGAFYLDGVSLNNLDHADAGMVIPEEVERVEIVKGPASALYGNFASAGSIHFHTIQEGDFTRLKMQYGSFNTTDEVGVIARRDGSLDQVYAGEIFHTDGYQDNSTWNKQNAAARFTYHVGEQLDAALGLRVHNSSWDSPGYIPQRVYDQNPARAVSDVNGGDKKWGQAQTDLTYRLNESSNFKWNGWVNSDDRTRWSQNWISSSQKVGANYGSESVIQREAFGTGLTYNYLAQVFERETRLVVGAETKREYQTYEYWYLKVGNGRTRGAKYQDDEVTIYTNSLYGELNYQLFRPLRVVLGGRYDMLSGDLDRNFQKTSYDRSGPDIFSPKAGLILTPLEGYEVFANYGKGFALPGVTDYMTKSYLDPAIRTQYETGVRVNPTKWLDGSLTFWRLDTEDDFQPTLDDPTLYENAGETRREGIELAANARPWRHLRLHFDYAYIQTEYLKYVDSGGVSRDGNELPNVPHNIFNLELAWEPPTGLGARLNYRYLTDWFVNAANTVKADAFDSVNLQVSYRFNPRYKLALDVVNLLDSKYAEYVGYTNGEKTYAPADPLSAYLTFTIDW